MSKIISVLCDADWMSKARARAYRGVFLVCFPGFFLLYLVLSHGGLDLYGRPLGTDFISFWTASQIALSGAPASAYDVATHWAAQKALFGDGLNYTAFFYPPVFLLLCLPLALLPYFGALALWLVASGAACFAALRALAGRPMAEFLALPAVWINVVYGQNGFVTTALFAAAAASIGSSPVLAGVYLGALVYKPHFLILAPFALLAGRCWRTILAAGVCAIALCALSLAVFGLQTWQAFLAGTALAQATLEQNLVGYEKMQSSFAAARLLGAGLTAAYAIQIVIAIGAAAVVVYLVWTRPVDERLGVALVSGTVCATPFLLPYDLMLMAVPMAWLLREAGRGGFRPWEKTVMMLNFITPLVAAPLALHTHIPIGPLAILSMFAVVARRIVVSPPADRPAGAQTYSGAGRSPG